MPDATHNDLNAKVRALIDDALAELVLLGLPSADEAASLMAIQSMIRIGDEAILCSVVEFANSLIDPEGERQSVEQ